MTSAWSRRGAIVKAGGFASIPAWEDAAGACVHTTETLMDSVTNGASTVVADVYLRVSGEGEGATKRVGCQ